MYQDALNMAAKNCKNGAGKKGREKGFAAVFDFLACDIFGEDDTTSPFARTKNTDEL